MTDRVVVVGAGISGVACARVLHGAGVPVRVLDRGERIGGRMAVRTEHWDGREHPVDLGAQYFTVHDDRFATVVEDWAARGLARPWTDTFHLAGPDGLLGTTTGPVRWTSPLGLRALVEDLATGLDVVHPAEAAVVGISPDEPPTVDGEPATAVVLAMPDPAARSLLPAEVALELGLSEAATWSPTICVWAAWAERWWREIDAAFVQDSAVLTWIADDGRRRGDLAAVLVGHVAPVTAAGRLEDPDSAVEPVLAEFRRVLGPDVAVPQPDWARSHAWPLASALHLHGQPFGWHEAGVGVCGDAWGPRSRVEQAWVSGHLLGEHLALRL